jgi:uncharacterized membrane protein
MQKTLRSVLTWSAVLIIWTFLLFNSNTIFGLRGYYISAAIMSLSLVVALILSFERSDNNALKLALISVMSALCIVGRIAFIAIPMIKPVAALVIISGIALGPQAGFVVGSMTMLISNFMFSQGPWTLWQMFSFGLLGFISGVIFYNRERIQNRFILAVYGLLIYVLVCGPILDLSGVFGYMAPTRSSLATTLALGFPVNLAAGISTFILLILISPTLLKKLKRVKIKNGIK